MERWGISSAVLRMGWNIRRQLPTVAPDGPHPPHMRRRARAGLALETLVVHRNDPHIDEGVVASAIGVSASHLSHILGKESLPHFETLLHVVRMVDVVVVLCTSTLCMKEVAGIVGYDETKAMDRLFQKWFHLTPSAFRSAVLRRSQIDAVSAVCEFRLQHPRAQVAECADATGIDFGLAARLCADAEGPLR